MIIPRKIKGRKWTRTPENSITDDYPGSLTAPSMTIIKDRKYGYVTQSRFIKRRVY